MTSLTRLDMIFIMLLMVTFMIVLIYVIYKQRKKIKQLRLNLTNRGLDENPLAKGSLLESILKRHIVLKIMEKVNSNNVKLPQWLKQQLELDSNELDIKTKFISEKYNFNNSVFSRILYACEPLVRDISYEFSSFEEYQNYIKQAVNNILYNEKNTEIMCNLQNMINIELLGISILNIDLFESESVVYNRLLEPYV